MLLSQGLAAGETAAAARLGLEPMAPIHLVAEQSEALCLWHKAGFRAMPLVHVSARLNVASTQLDETEEGEPLRVALDGESCETLRSRTGSFLRTDALYDTDTFLVAASRLGVVSEVWWVIPTRQRLPEGKLDLFRAALRDDYQLPPEFLDGLRQEGTVVRGAYRGLPVRIVTLADLPPPDRPALVTIDAEYIVGLYENPVHERMLDLLGAFFVTLRERRVAAEHLVVSASFANGRVPLGFAYLGSWLRDLLAEPARFAAGPPEAWRAQDRVEYLSFMEARDDAAAEAVRLAELAPAEPAPWYDRALLAAGGGDAAEALPPLEEAVRREPAYRSGYVALANLFLSRGRPGDARTLLEQGSRRFPADVALTLALAETYLQAGLFAEAVAITGQPGGGSDPYPALAAARAFALRGAGREAEAAEAMATFLRTVPEGGLRRSVRAAWEAEPAAPPAGSEGAGTGTAR